MKSSSGPVKLGTWRVDFYASAPTGRPFNNTFLFTERFTVWGPDAYQVTLSISGLPSDAATQIYVDGTPRTEIKVGEERIVTLDKKQTVSIDSAVGQAKGTRYYCSQYAYNVYSAAKLSFSYKLQYYLTIINGEGSPPKSKIEGEGWYDKDTSAKLKASPTESREAGKTIIFSGWKEDSTIASNNPEYEIVMNSPKTVTATWSSRVDVTETYDITIIFAAILVTAATAGLVLVRRKRH